jgi:hypothetical protein
VTFRAKIKSSGYGAAAAVRPSWAVSKAKAVIGRGKKGDATTGESIAEHPPLTSHPSPTPELIREDRQVFGKAPASALAAASSAALSAGPVACLGFSPIGDAFFVGAHAGDFYTGSLDVVDGNLRAGLITRRTGLPGRALNAAFSAGTFARASVGLVSVDREEVRPVAAPPASADFATAAGRVRRAAEQRPGVRTSPPARLMLGAGEDSAAYIWAVGAGASASPLLALRSPAGGDASTNGGGGAPFPGHVTAAQFAYVDRLVLLSNGSRIYALRYTLGDDEEHDDSRGAAVDEDASAARRRAAGRRYTVVASWASEDTGAVVALAAPNAWRSPLVFAAFADKTVRAFDLSVAGGGENHSPPEVLRITNAHSRGLHTLALPLASSLCDVSEASLDCVLSAAADGAVKLWDVRSASCARNLSGSHTNRAGRVGIALSPCATYVAAGSECGRTAVYDLRNGGDACSILTGSRDSISAVAWHPALPRLAVASLDGGVRFYAPP